MDKLVTFICFPPRGTQNLLSPREDTSRTGEAKLNLVRLRTFRLREIVFELIAKSYNFERGFFFFQSTPLLTSPSERNYVYIWTNPSYWAERSISNRTSRTYETACRMAEGLREMVLLFLSNLPLYNIF